MMGIPILYLFPEKRKHPIGRYFMCPSLLEQAAPPKKKIRSLTMSCSKDKKRYW